MQNVRPEESLVRVIYVWILNKKDHLIEQDVCCRREKHNTINFCERALQTRAGCVGNQISKGEPKHGTVEKEVNGEVEEEKTEQRRGSLCSS